MEGPGLLGLGLIPSHSVSVSFSIFFFRNALFFSDELFQLPPPFVCPCSESLFRETGTWKYQWVTSGFRVMPSHILSVHRYPISWVEEEDRGLTCIAYFRIMNNFMFYGYKQFIQFFTTTKKSKSYSFHYQ